MERIFFTSGFTGSNMGASKYEKTYNDYLFRSYWQQSHFSATKYIPLIKSYEFGFISRIIVTEFSAILKLLNFSWFIDLATELSRFIHIYLGLYISIYLNICLSLFSIYLSIYLSTIC